MTINGTNTIDKVNLQRIGVFLCSIILIFINACTGLKTVPKDQFLVTKNELVLKDKKKVAKHKTIQNELSGLLTPEPNNKVLWMRPRLSIYHMVSEPKKEKGFRNWLKNKVGKPPALLNEDILEKINLAIENRLFHYGHFNANSEYEVENKKKTAQIAFIVESKDAYMIDTLILPKPTDPFTQLLSEINNNSLIKKNETYTLDLLKEERERIDSELKNLGYFYFDPDFLIFSADTTNGNYTVKLKIEQKKNIPPEASKIYTIDQVTVAEDFKLENYNPDTVEMGEYSIVTATEFMRPEIFMNSILLNKGDVYSKKAQSYSMSQLMALQSYKYVNTRFVPAKDFTDKLDLTYIMTPSQKMALSTEVNVVSKTNNFLGPGAKLSYKNRNVFRGAELFSFNINGNFEKQVSGDAKGDTAYELNAEVGLQLPRLIPFKLTKRDKPFLPTSNIIAGAGIFTRVSLYKFRSYSVGLEYTVRRNKYMSHVLKPIDISVTNLVEKTEDFEKFLESNPSIKKSFEEQFIIGGAYSFIINKLGLRDKPEYYINMGVDPSGNLAVGLSKLIRKTEDPDKPVSIFDTPISQYFRVRTDLRYYFKIGIESKIATRLYAGVGLPYGNSTVMPYVKQFYAGGTNSMRAFRARSLGPGAYHPQEGQENILVDQTGDIKLEANVEYRFPISNYLKGALFTDIGNIWLVNADPLRPEGQFIWGEFQKDLAMGLGFGLRIDIDVVVVRFDWAFPVRKPWLLEGERWVFDAINPFSKTWRKNNLLWNISIGYPF